MRTIVILLSLFLCLSAPVGALNLDSLLVESIGGPAALDSLKTIYNYRAEGSVELNGQPGTFNMYFALPDLFYAEMRLGGISMAQAYDGHTAWMRDFNGQISEMGGFEEKELLKQIYLQSFAYLIDGRVPGSKSYVGMKEIDGTLYHEVLFMPLNDDTMHVFIDPETAYPVLQTSRLDNIETISRSSDFRTAHGVVMAFRTASEAIGAPIRTVTEIEEIFFNDDFDHAIFYRDGESRIDYHFPPEADSVVIPFEFVDGHIVVAVVINGSHTSKFILDSGASANLIDKALADKLGLAQVGTIAARGVAGFDEVGLVQPDSIAIGDLVLYHQTAGKLDLAAVLRAHTVDPRGGILGYDFLSRFPIRVDYRNRQLCVYNPDTFQPAPGGVEVPFSLTSRVPTVDASVDGVPGSFVVDLGNAYGLILHPHFVSSNSLEPRLVDLNDLSGAIGGVGGALAGQTAIAPRFEIGSLQLDSLPIIIPDAHIGLSGSESLAGNVGNQVLRKFSVLFDYRQSRLIFYPNER